MKWTDVFTQLETTTFSNLKPGDLFAILNTEKANKYWRTERNNYSCYLSPIIAKKLDENTLQELMTDFPVPRARVDSEKAKTIHVIRVNFIG